MANSLTGTERVPYGWIALLLVLTGVLGASSVLLTPQGASVAAWWPASGTAVIALLLARDRLWRAVPLLVVVGTIGNMVGGRPLGVSLAFGTINSIESIIVVLVLARLVPGRTLRSIGDVLRFFAAALAGSLSLALLASLAAVLLVGADPVRTFREVLPSHASAIIVIVPLAIVGRAIFRPRLRELLPQAAVLLGVVLVVFLPGSFLPLAFLPLPVLTWAAIRFGSRVVTIELAATSALSLVLTVAGGGPFAFVAYTAGAFTPTLLQIYFLSYATSLLLLAAVAAEREVALKSARTSEAMLRAGLGAAQIGLLILDRVGGRTRIVESNPAAGRLLREIDGHLEVADTHLSDTIESLWNSPAGSWTGEWDAPDETRRQGFASVINGDRMSVQVVDVTARHLAERATAAALENELATAEALRDLNRRQDEFVSSVSHELRTPLSSVIGFTDELQLTELDETQQTYASVIARNGQRLLTVVNNLLTLAALERREASPEAEPRELSRLIREGVEDLQAHARTGAVALTFSSGVDELAQTAHPQEVAQILTNILSNAVKFTPAGGQVTVSLSCTEGMASIAVMDTGRGIPPTELEDVFEKFVRSSNSGSTPGTGLGLPIARKMIETMGGSIRLESDGISGTTALMTLPTIVSGSRSPRSRSAVAAYSPPRPSKQSRAPR